MSDRAEVAAWKPRFAEWTQKAMPLLQSGKAKEAFAQYPWFTTGEGPVPFTRLAKPASESRFALITTGGYSIEGEQEPVFAGPRFDDTDPDLRMIPFDVDQSRLRIDHFGYDHRFAEQDVNVNLPLDRLKEMRDAGEIGSLSEETAVVMGLQPNVEPLIEKLIPALVDRFTSDSVEGALLVPS